MPLLFLTALPAYRLTAQVTIQGRILRVSGSDTTALAGPYVVAHEIGETRQGPIDSMRSDAGGRFRFVVNRPDTGTVYVVSASHQGIGYFSEPIQSGRAAVPLTLVVFDTSAAGPPLDVTIRHVVVTRGDAGQHRVLDIFQLQNRGSSTRVGRDTLSPVWTARLPEGVQNLQPGESDVPASAIQFGSGRVEMLAPVPPGLKQVVITYDLAPGARTLVITTDQVIERLEVLLEDSTATVGGNLTADEPVEIEGRTFRRYSADSLAAGANPVIRFGATSIDARRYGWVAVAAVALALLAGAVLALRRRTGTPAAAAPATTATGPLDEESDDRLAAQVAALDAKFEGREAETDAEVWASYQRRRTELTAALARRVARTPGVRTDSSHN